ncbi:MAG TPA: hypothetical protein VGP99_08100 [Tepidisphaeraceae bacterium]|jgi:hypothetical protein|nr:hypothetical protein [Tepidisphaeraceae bacterium]
MKKISALLLLAILLGTFGCDNDQPKPNKEPPAPPKVPQPQVK